MGENLRRSVLQSGGDASVFLTRPLSLVFVIATVLILVVMMVPCASGGGRLRIDVMLSARRRLPAVNEAM
jgi:TctA family transporter